MRPPTPLRALAALAAVGGALALPANAPAASTTTFCVNAASCPADGIKTSLSAALSGARAGAGPANILLGPSPDGKPYAGPFTYPDGASGDNFVVIQGQGRPVLTSAVAGKAVLEIHGLGVSSVSGVDVVVPPLTGADGLRLVAASATDVHVRGGGAAGLNRGIALTDGNVAEATIDMKSGFAVELVGGSNGIVDSTLSAPFGIIGADTNLRLDATRVRAEHKALQLIGSAGGGGGGFIEDGLKATNVVATTSAADGQGVFLRDVPARLFRTTVASRSAAPAAGTTALAFEATKKDAPLEVRTSVLAGYARRLSRSVSGGHVAPLHVVDSEWSRAGDADGGDAAGSRLYDGLADAAPRFVDRLGGDLRLRGGDAAIDLNRSATPSPFDVADIEVKPAVDGHGNGSLRTDAGAHEYLRRAPVITALDATAPGFAATAADADGDAVSVVWKFGDGATAEGASVTHAYLPGTYDGTVTARDDAGLETTKPFSVTVASPSPAPGPGDAARGDAPAVDPASPSSGTGAVVPSGVGADRFSPVIRSARLRARRGARRARLVVTLSEAARLRVTVARRTLTIALPAGRSVRTVKIGARRRVAIVAVDAAGNRSAVKRLKVRTLP
jgi:hypothetical protein